ncbi:IS200/IS605 family transposase [Candidatus Woesearchaeota archaeon]|nr:IS200/IS605 family transposase [Nanoarchaeota archaeon]MCB9370994.1 IS200/IS605 family transposase [Candidatus Woesearchaeota archaeon]USN44096.1 MAG: IS200/IS605 family transposase [Candidatus Woesearchaeota archaeon]USN44462.1 MAG: IS200/IS605 family transposase [Candidatus Woesearchaeota archaeon]
MRNYKSYRRSHCVGWSEFHLQWCTKYRYKLFKNNLYKNICAIFLVECSMRYNFKLQEFEIDIDHVHVIVSLPLVMSPSQVVMYLKGFSSKCSVFAISRT